ncbi:hypothetical protein Dimus_006223 [Dionaea muscipula]
MEFDEEEQEKEEEEDEINLVPPQSYISSLSLVAHPAARPRIIAGGGNGVPATAISPQSAAVAGGRNVGGGGSVRAKYRECLKNHAVNIGGHATDGCGEFMPAGEEGTLGALKCAACNCHRNFHRKATDVEVGEEHYVGEVAALYHHGPPPYYRTAPPGGCLHVASTGGGGMAVISGGGAPVLPSTGTGAHHRHLYRLPSSSSGGTHQSLDEVVLEEGMSGGGGGVGKKRVRTKFSEEQKEKMVGFAEKLGWRIQKQDEGAVQQFCEQVQVKRQVLKVWMHNNKHTLGAKKGLAN